MMEKFTFKFSEKEQLTENTFVFSLDCPDFDFQAGQFLTFLINDAEGTPRPRSYSLLNPPSQGKKQMLIELIEGGLAGETFKAANELTEFAAIGPLGKFVFHDDKQEHIFVATNTGIAPLYSMIKEYLPQGHSMTLVFGAKNKQSLFFHDEFLALNQKDNFTYIPTVSREDLDNIPKGYVQPLIPIKENVNYYICGSPQMVRDTIDLLQEKNIPKDCVHYEIFT